jgi:xylulokinase
VEGAHRRQQLCDRACGSALARTSRIIEDQAVQRSGSRTAGRSGINRGPNSFELPRLVWPGEVVGRVSAAVSAATTIPEGVPVIAGTIDAWSEAISVGAQNPGDLMLMFGTTMFLMNTVEERLRSASLWGTVGALPGTRNLAGGMATSGAITQWLREMVGSPDYDTLIAEADAAGAGAHGSLMLPYFAGERTPIADPRARGIIVGLTLEHTRGDLYRATLEATAFGVRHNVEALRTAGGRIDRAVAVGGERRVAYGPRLSVISRALPRKFHP